MKITSIGGGPAGLYFGILMRKVFPDVEVEIFERNRADDTFGWGVVFSDETLDNVRWADPESYAEIERNFIHWTDIETHYAGTCVTSTGHGFSGLSRKRLLQILQGRAIELGVQVHFEHEISDVVRAAGECDLLLGADGVNSLVRETWKEHFRPSLDWRKCKFSWLGTDKQLEAFTFIFKENQHGLFQVHAYPFEEGLSTWIVECHEDVWKRAGLDRASEEDTVRYCSELFAAELDGHRLLNNRSIWRTFPTVTNETWHHENVVLLGDAAHTAHFSIGSGTKLALEDSIALVDAFREHGTADVPRVLDAYEEARQIDVLKTQKAAQTSLEWFENSARYMRQDPVAFQFNLMTRSKRITWDNLALRDPELVRRTGEAFARANDVAQREDGSFPEPMFAPFALRELTLENRVVVSPMCQYSAVDGTPTDWHLVHLGARATGGAGLVMTEMTNVEPEGRITHGCAGLYSDENEAGWKRIVDFVHEHSRAKIGMQLAHAGRKASCSRPWEGDAPLRDGSGWSIVGPSADPFDAGWPVPRRLERADMERLTAAFVAATWRCERIGFDLIELHMAHGYLLSSFLSPAANHRTDEYGGSLQNRMRWPLEVFEAMRAAWPASKPMSVRISATDWIGERGTTIEDSLVLARALQERGVDVLDVSSAGNTPESQPVYGRMYQVPFAERIRYEVGVPVMAVGAVQGPDHVNTILAAGRVDLCALARPHLVNPAVTLGAAARYQHDGQFWPPQYRAAQPRPR